ncbi:mechanosensitive channel [Pontimonas salivibrio]|uniref:Mechanosensitive channel n=1 Tax=Pontimonas salivibrio TaxID=1159327 RepID=A0A2L2BQG4_9MICO|nr:mechanosensitive ion channel family protein [Pontimonas salivibrio]AVG23862.1 mechanosensitive channel [Pontimonas salivibrio]
MELWIGIATQAGIALGLSLAVLFILWLVVKIIGRKVPWLPPAYEDIRPRLRFTVVVLASLISVASIAQSDQLWWRITTQALLILLILSAGFLLQEVVNYSISRVINTFEQGDLNNADTRRIATQLRLLRRLGNAVIGIVTIGLALFTFPDIRGLGAGVLASAGVLGVIGGLAAQSVLGNLFAGIQLAFSDAIRVGDVVVVEGEWGTVGEITLSYVVVYIWDERRLIVPSTYFTSHPFETWTRHSPKVYGVVMVDMDWRVPVEAVREEFHRFINTTDLWDGRTADCLVTDATGGYLQVRFVASAEDSSKQWALRCLIREHIVAWLRENYPDALPSTRVIVEQETTQSPK